jgi:hypothetical protein
LVNAKAKSAGDSYPKKAIEKTILRFLDSQTFSPGLHPFRTFGPAHEIETPALPDFPEWRPFGMEMSCAVIVAGGVPEFLETWPPRARLPVSVATAPRASALDGGLGL